MRNQKIERLKESQERLRERQPTVFNLKMQQEALRRGLLLRRPMVEDRCQKLTRLREEQRVAKSLRLRRDKEEKERIKVIEKLRKEQSKVKISNEKKLNSLFFPQGKRRRR